MKFQFTELILLCSDLNNNITTASSLRPTIAHVLVCRQGGGSRNSQSWLQRERQGTPCSCRTRYSCSSVIPHYRPVKMAFKHVLIQFWPCASRNPVTPVTSCFLPVRKDSACSSSSSFLINNGSEQYKYNTKRFITHHAGLCTAVTGWSVKHRSLRTLTRFSDLCYSFFIIMSLYTINKI